MPKKDILLYNSASRGFTTNLGSDVVRIQGSSDELLSIQNSSGTEQLKVGTSKTSLTFNAPLTASGHFSGSSVSSASFGRVVATTFHGDGSEMTDTPISSGTVSSSAQFASEISGAFDSGFEFVGTISGSSTTTGSFSNLNAADGFSLGMDISGVTNRIASGVVSGAAQIATEISGAFQGGFDFTGGVSGSRTSTGSFSLVHTDAIRQGDGRFLTNITYTPSTFSSSAQIASEISGAFTEGFQFEETISGSATSTGSFGNLIATTFLNSTSNTDVSEVTNVIPASTVSSSAQIAADISGSFTSGFEYGGTISGSATSSGSFGHIIVDDLTAGSITNLCEIANVIPSVMISSSAQISSDISGSFISGFGHDGTISGSATSTGSFSLLNVTSNYVVGDSSEITNAISALTSDTVSGSAQLASDISGSFLKGFEFSGQISGSSTSKLDIGRLDFNDLSVSDFVNSELTEIIPTGTLVDGSATTIASQISGAFDSGFEFTGAISGSSTTSGSFNMVCADVFPTVDLTGMTGLNQSEHISSSAQLAADISGSFTSGFSGILNIVISGSSTSTGSFNLLGDASTIYDVSDVSGLTNFLPLGVITGASEIATAISGSFQKGYIPEAGLISGSSTSTGSFNHFLGKNLETSEIENKGMTVIPVEEYGKAYSTQNWDATGSVSTGEGGYGLTGTGSFSQYDNDYGVAGQLFVTNDGLLNITYETGSTVAVPPVWTEGPDTVSTRKDHASVFGTQNAVLISGGRNPSSDTSFTEDFNGISWTELNDLTLAAHRGSGAGTTNAGIQFGAYTGPQAKTEIWNGVTWHSAQNLGTGRATLAGAGTQNSALAMSGYSPGMETKTELFNGISWSELNDNITGRRLVGGDGTSDAAFIAAGGTPAKVACTEEWNGSTWSTGGALGAARYGQGAWGSVNAAVQAGGGGVTKLTEEYNGTSWSETTNTIATIAENNAAGDAGLGMTIQNETVVEMWTGGFIPSSSFGDPNNYLKTCKIKPNLISHYSGSSQEDN